MKKAFNHLADALGDGGETALDAYFSMKKAIDNNYYDAVNVLQYRREKTVLKRIAYKYKQIGNEADYYWLLAEIEMFEPSPQSYERADEMYRKHIEINEKGYGENPCYDSRRELSISYGNLANMLSIQCTEETLKEAEQLYRKSIELAEQNCNENPCYDSRRNLATSYSNFALLLTYQKSEKNDKVAEQLYKKSIELDEQSYKENLSYDSRRGLSASYSNYGVFLFKNRKYLLAEEYFVKSVELLEIILQDFNKQEIKTILIKIYQKLISMCENKNTPKYKQQVKKWKKRLFELLYDK